ncbi:MAG: PIG-L family deacetylase [Chloroflexota bacterium]
MAQPTLLVVHAHPDDEVFSTGGMLAKYASQGYRVVVVYGTRGEEGEIHLPEGEALRSRLGEIREAEVREATELLGINDIRFLGYRDSGMAETEANANPAAFANAPLDEATGRLVDIMRDVQPQVVVAYDESGGYGHPDHIMSHKVATAAFQQLHGQPGGPQKLYYSTRSRDAFRRYVTAMREIGQDLPWLTEDFDFDAMGTPDNEISTFIDITPFAPLKKRALAVHRSQISPDFFYLNFPDEWLSQYDGTEYFNLITPAGIDGREHDLFAGVRLDEAAA